MAKTSLTPTEMDIWHHLLTFTTWQQENVVRDLDRQFGLRPRVLKLVNVGYVPYTFPRFETEVTKNDFNCTAYYSPKDASLILGSREKNYRDWVRALLGCGSDPHVHFQEIPWRSVQTTASVNKPGEWPNRFLSVQALTFYLAAQSRTWGDTPARHARITKVKSMLSKHRVQNVQRLPAFASDLSDLDLVAPPAPRRVPKTVVLATTVPEPEVKPAPLPVAPAPQRSLLTELREMSENDYHNLMTDVTSARRQRSPIRELRQAVRDAVGGDPMALGVIVLNDKLQPWMIQMVAADALGKSPHTITNEESQRVERALMLLSDILPQKQFGPSALMLAGLTVKSRNQAPFRMREFRDMVG